MPIYEYQSLQAGNCSYCSNGFDRLQKLSDEPLRHCPECGLSIRRIISAPNVGKADVSLQPKNLERHGFTQYRKSDHGVYEKTAGKGPDTIKKDG